MAGRNHLSENTQRRVFQIHCVKFLGDPGLLCRCQRRCAGRYIQFQQGLLVGQRIGHFNGYRRVITHCISHKVEWRDD